MNVCHSFVLSAAGIMTLQIICTTTTISSPTTIVKVMIIFSSKNCTYGAKVSVHVARELY